ncbi:uncharacterized protein LOC115236062 [Formica exsecta]|uniref:uncharacterized protein LOC115236062 n=1 Tax=Formica exsecta TaxID=72781 RepID=UPI0011447F3F|nr:uncharacterized protein LOC115236062 [Formica exsecta]
MLAFAVRGVVLLGVLSWYSATVWKMIDGYFKDQFRGYLQDEYRKHPRMKVDVESIRIVDKGPVPSVLSAESSLKYGIAEIYDSDATCPVDIIDACQQAIGASNGKSEESVARGTGENAADTVGVSPTFKNAFPENEFPGRSKLESRKSSSGSDEENDEERQPSAINQNGDRENEAIKKSPASYSRRLNEKRLSKASKEILKERSREKPKKRRVNKIVLTDTDFAGAKIRNDANDDFSEFEEEDGQRVREEGILVSELPFKPKADIGDLDRVTAEEFCPLTLEDEASCGETTTWP